MGSVSMGEVWNRQGYELFHQPISQIFDSIGNPLSQCVNSLFFSKTQLPCSPRVAMCILYNGVDDISTVVLGVSSSNGKILGLWEGGLILEMDIYLQ
jgi:hypothetical protein